MSKGTISRVFVLGAFLASGTIGVNAVAQTTMRPVNPSTTTTQQSAAHKAAQNAAHNNPACQRIVQECEKLGFIVGEWKQDNGVWKDCFDPVVHGGTPTREGKPINVPVSQNDIQACRGAVSHPRQGAH